MSDILFLLQQMLFFSMPLLVVAVGGLFSEKSGIVNIALEGLMVFGAFTGVTFLFLFGESLPPQLALIMAMIVAMIGGGLFAALHAYASVYISANQSISGMALNILAPAITMFVAKEVTGSRNIAFLNNFFIESVPVLSKIPILGPLLFERAYLTTYVAIAVFLIGLFVITKSKFGLRLRACGECPHAVAVAGASVEKIRFTAVVISGILAGLGGIVFVIPTSVEFTANVSGYGFLAVAVVVFSRWNIKRLFGSALFFGFMQTIANTYSGIGFFDNLSFIPAEFYKMLPYVATVIVLWLSNSTSSAPEALGDLYDVSER